MNNHNLDNAYNIISESHADLYHQLAPMLTRNAYNKLYALAMGDDGLDEIAGTLEEQCCKSYRPQINAKFIMLSEHSS